MPRTTTVEKTIYKFKELSERAQENALSNLSETACDYEWWDCTFDDAATIGLKITSFDLDRNRHAEGKFINGPHNCAEAILKEHGENCETYKTAKDYLAKREGIKKHEAQFYDDDARDADLEELAEDFRKSLLEDYSIMLQKEYEYLTSREALLETIECNGYEFTEDGRLG